ncbi:hypothetical protein Tco_0439205 [Tanacetum coccineum]
MQEKLKFSKSQGASTRAEIQRMQNIPYVLVVGSIMYVVRCTRLDVAFVQNITSRFQRNPVSLAFDCIVRGLIDVVNFISGLVFVPTIEEPINMYCDNTGAIAIAKDHGVTKGARHFRAKVHYLRETIEIGDVKIRTLLTTDDNLSLPFHKGFSIVLNI